MMNAVFVFVNFNTDDPSAVLEFQLGGRSPTLPFGARWAGASGWWIRDANVENVDYEVNKTWPRKVRSWRYLDFRDIPEDKTFRDAWREDGPAKPDDTAVPRKRIDVHMPKARVIHREHIRAVRTKILPALDVEQLRSTEVVAQTGTPAAETSQIALKKLVARKQALRDAPADPRIDVAQTPEELKAVWPEELGENPWR